MATEIISRKDARAQGLRRYFTGKPCKNGHLDERFVSDATCRTCDVARCRAQKKRRAASDAKRHKDNPEPRRERARLWRLANPDKAKAAQKAWRQANRDRHRKNGQRWYFSNPARQRELAERWEQKNPDRYRDTRAATSQRRRARKKGAAGKHNADDANSILTAQGYRFAYCKDDLRKKQRHLDHILPLVRGGSNDKANLQWLCAACNLAKGAKHPIDFAQERLGLLL